MSRITLFNAIRWRRAWVAAACLLLSSAGVLAQAGRSGDWLTWGGNPERAAWNRSERELTKETVRRLELKWKTQIDARVPIEIESGASMLTAPLAATGIRTAQGTKTLVYTLAASNTLAAIDAATGKVAWRVTLENTVDPVATADWVCTNTSTATPVIDKARSIIYTIASDGRLHGLDIATGQRKMVPASFVPPYSRNWSLNLIDGVMYTTVGRGCGNSNNPETPALPPGAPPAAAGRAGPPRPPPVASHMIAIDLIAPSRPIARFFSSRARPGGAWSRAGMAWGFDSLFAMTADGAFDPAAGQWGQTLLRLKPKTLEMMDYFTPPNLEEINSKDLDYASGGVVAFTYRNRDLVVSAGKDGTVYLHDAKSLGGADHRTPLFSLKAGNDEMTYASTGVWGAPSTVVNARNERWVYVPMWGPPSTGAKFERANGDAPHGSIMAFQVTLDGDKPVLIPKWVSRDMSVPDPPVVANGVVFAISTGENTLQRHTDPRYQQLYKRADGQPLSTQGILTAEERGQQVTHVTLYAFDADTGAELYSSRDLIDDWTHLSSITVADGQIYVTTRKTNVYAFGLAK